MRIVAACLSRFRTVFSHGVGSAESYEISFFKNLTASQALPRASVGNHSCDITQFAVVILGRALNVLHDAVHLAAVFAVGE